VAKGDRISIQFAETAGTYETIVAGTTLVCY
jgi:hypothetical protein